MGEQLKRIAEEEYEMAMTPLIDVTFLLLIFFLLTIKFKLLEGKLSAYLPKDVGVNTSPAEPKEKVEIRIDVKEPGIKCSPFDQRDPYIPDRHKRYDYRAGTRKVTYSIGPRKTSDLKELTKQIREFYEKDNERPATLDCRPGTVYGDMIPVLDAAMDIGYTDITFVGEYDAPKK